MKKKIDPYQVDMFAAPVVKQVEQIVKEFKIPAVILEPVATVDLSKIFVPPLFITIKTDGNILQLIGNKNKIFTYKYVKSLTKLNFNVTFTEELLVKLINQNL